MSVETEKERDPNTEAREQLVERTRRVHADCELESCSALELTAALEQAGRALEQEFQLRGEAEALLGEEGAGGSAVGLVPAIHNLASERDSYKGALEQERELREQAEVDTERKVDAKLRQKLEQEREKTLRGWGLAHGAASAIENLPILEADDWLRTVWIKAYNAALASSSAASPEVEAPLPSASA